MTSVLVRNRKVVKVINANKPLRSSDRANGGQRRRVASGVTNIYIGGTVTISNGVVTAITNPDTTTAVQKERELIKRRLRYFDSLPVANWGLNDARTNGTLQSRKSRGFWNWMENIARASKLDANLSNATILAKIKREADQDPFKWYRLFAQSYVSFRPTVFYPTPATNDGTIVADSSVPMTATWDSSAGSSSLVEYIYSD